MKILDRLKRWRRQKLRNKAAKDNCFELREFIYLDEVSIYSLLSSKLGPIATDFTETETNSLQGELSGGITATTPIISANMESKISSAQNNTSQVVRKSIIQTHFKELYEFEKKTMLHNVTTKYKDIDIITNINDFQKLIKSNSYTNWIINSSDLLRGKLIEFDFKLEAEPIFQISTVISTIKELLEDYHKEFDSISIEDISQLQFIDHIINKLLVGLIPIKGEIINYKIVNIDNSKYIIHTNIIDKMSFITQNDVSSLSIVGVTEQRLFWKDIRHLLFTKEKYRVFCRITRDGILKSWEPVKLIPILESIIPDLSFQIQNLEMGFLRNLSQTNKYNPNVQQELMKRILLSYAEKLFDKQGEFLDDDKRHDIQQLADRNSHLYNNQQEKLVAFREIESYFREKIHMEEPHLFFADCRDEINKEIVIQSIKPKLSNDFEKIPNENNNYIETEIIAIYW